MSSEVGIFGGSFNPPHVAHVMAVAYALSRLGLDEVLVLPVWRHPLDKSLAPFEDRMEMCRRAMSPLGALVRVLDLERRRVGPSYTIDLLQELKRERPDWSLTLIVGADAYAERHLWRRFAEIERLARVLVMARAGAPPPPASVSSSPPLPRVSSSEIRDHLAAGGEPRELLPARVADYIRARGLYLTPCAP